MFFHSVAYRIVAKASVNQCRRNFGVPQRFLDTIEIDTAPGKQAPECTPEIVQADIFKADR